MESIVIPALVLSPTAKLDSDTAEFILARANREFEASCERDEPIIQTSGKNPEELVVCWVQLMVWAELGVLNILNARGCLPPFWSQQVARQINDLRNINDGNRPEKARYLYWCYPDFRPLKALVWLSLESRRISGEIGRHFKKHKAGIKLIELYENTWHPKDAAELCAPFNTTLSGRRFETGNRADDEDYDQICGEGTARFYKKRHQTIESPALDQIQLETSLRPEWGFPNSSHSGWEMHTIAVGKHVVCDLYGDTLSLFKGGQDRALSAARQARKDNLKSQSAMMRIPPSEICSIDQIANIEASNEGDARLEATVELNRLRERAIRIANGAPDPNRVRRILIAMLDNGGDQAEAAIATRIPQQTVSNIWNKYSIELRFPALPKKK